MSPADAPIPPIRCYDAARVLAPQRAGIEAAIADVLDSGRFILGAAVERFECEFADHCGRAHAIGVASGSDALELALRALDVGPGDSVVTVANAGGYATHAIRACGARPLYAEVDPATLLLDPVALALLLTQRPRALVLTHLYGRLADVGTVATICAAHGIALVEDCAQAHGARRGGRHAGSFGALGCFSFYPTKNLGALGDGGALVTNDAALAARLRALRQYGWIGKYRVEVGGGRNSRLDELQAAILSVRLRSLDADNAKRRAIIRAYDDALAGCKARPLPGRGGEDDVGHQYVVRCADRNALRAHLAGVGIDSEVHYPVPDHLQPAWRMSLPQMQLPYTERACAEVLSLPCHPALTDVEVRRVIAAVRAHG
ncbi:MAG: DegT/DnrJ/EryC1/StrS family aminotransferase [Xanthomonadales bacterium]|nr:dTDP-3-amino-3,4,6-trideoxy-alpha-D-glucose transaminase [Xanthomonadales bacterium]MCC6594075.1 DegT/DnrJ/EryC1/StrS family aminotransferase [Xanthomonadales bacterium]MCE7930157.1 DegT/DnrJ/EryC1/StrS family aminotransferase [Xanthomonadales bacterium PRO6]